MSDTEFEPLRAVRGLLEKYDRPWWFAGGWALDLYAGRRRRSHSNVDILVLAHDADAFRQTFAEADLDIQVVLAEPEHEEPGYRTDDGLPYVAPEVVLLFASRDDRPNDGQDFADVVDLLAPERRAWLAERLSKGHSWLAELDRRPEALVIGGRSGVGKTSVGYEIADQLEAAGIVHFHVEGDNLDEAYPKPYLNPRTSWLCEANLSALWTNYAALGYRRMIYTNTAAAIEPESGWISRAMGDARVIPVLLTASDETAAARLADREIGGAYDWHVERSNTAARELDVIVPERVPRVPTDGRTVADIAREIVELTGWVSRP